MDRRKWITSAAAALAAIAGQRSGQAAGQTSEGSEPKEMEQSQSFSLPVYRVSGKTYRELGEAIGQAARGRIQAALAGRREWVAKLREFAESDPGPRIKPFIAALEDEFPHLLDELRGIAHGAEVDFKDLFSVAQNPELSALMKGVSFYEDCTTVAVNHGGRQWVAHNEDGSTAYRDLMYLLDITFPDGQKSFCLSYPGYWPGNGPNINSSGIMQTVNYIGGQSVRPGVLRYALDRAIMEANNIEQAVKIATHSQRAYSQHHLLVSAAEGRMVSVETSAEKVSVREIDGAFAHANHLIHDSMSEVPQFSPYKGSSIPRQDEADLWIKNHPDLAALTSDDLAAVLASHARAPLSICRHPVADTAGSTLGAFIVSVERRAVRVFQGPACQGIARDFAWPS